MISYNELAERVDRIDKDLQFLAAWIQQNSIHAVLPDDWRNPSSNQTTKPDPTTDTATWLPSERKIFFAVRGREPVRFQDKMTPAIAKQFLLMVDAARVLPEYIHLRELARDIAGEKQP